MKEIYVKKVLMLYYDSKAWEKLGNEMQEEREKNKCFAISKTLKEMYEKEKKCLNL